MPNDEPQFDSLPKPIIDALREMDGPAVMPDPIRDADVLSGARQHLAGAVPRRRSRWRLAITGATSGAVAAAAMVGIVVYIGNPASEPIAMQADEMAMTKAMPTITAPPMPGDINHNGSVDILDAYALAKRIETGQVDEMHDLNANDQIDQHDIDWIAHRAVALHTGDPS